MMIITWEASCRRGGIDSEEYMVSSSMLVIEDKVNGNKILIESPATCSFIKNRNAEQIKNLPNLLTKVSLERIKSDQSSMC